MVPVPGGANAGTCPASNLISQLHRVRSVLALIRGLVWWGGCRRRSVMAELPGGM